MFLLTMVMKRFLCLALTLAVSFPAFSMDLLSTVAISGRAQDVQIQGSYAYCADQYGLWVLDVSNPQQPNSVGHWGSPGLSISLTSQSDVAYLCDGSHGLAILDVSDPAAPDYLGQAGGVTNAFAAALSGNYLYVASGMDGLAVLDVGNSQAPLKIGEYATAAWTDVLAVNATMAALATADGQIHLLDIADPANPALLSQIQVLGITRQVLFDQNLLIALTAETGASLWDVSVPASPSLRSSFSTGGWSTDMTLLGDTLIVADWFDGVTFYDISDPARPDFINSFMPDGSVEGMALQGNLLGLAAGEDGLEFWDVSNLSSPSFQGSQMPVGSPQDVAYASEGYVFEAAGDAGLRVWNADLQSSQPIAQVQTSGWANAIALSPGWVYLADGFGGLRIYHRSSSPAEAFSLPTEEYAGSLSLNASHVLFVAQGDSGFLSLRLEGLSAPQEYGSTSTAHFVYDVAASNELLIACEGAEGFEIFNVVDPANPQLLALAQPEGGAWCALVAGASAYVGAGTDGICAYNLSTPQTPQLLGSTGNVGWVQSLSYDGNGTLIASSGVDGLFALSTAQIPPIVADAYDTPGLARRAAFMGSNVVCADEMDLSLLGGILSVPEPVLEPLTYGLLNAYPNPFNPTTRISFSLPAAAPVDLAIYDLLGRQVASLMTGRLAAGDHVFAWQPDGRIASGSYLLRFKAGSEQTVRQLIYLK